MFSCPAVNGLISSVVSKSNAAGACAPTLVTGGDPLLKGFDGCAWYLKGKPDLVMNLVTEANHVVNTKLVAANLVDEHHGEEGTFHGAIAMRFQGAVVKASVDPEGHLTVLLEDKAVPFGAFRKQSGLTVNVTEHYPHYGQVLEVATPAFRFFVHAVQPYDTAAGWSRGHLDFTATVTAANIRMHGLLGQDANGPGAECRNDFKFYGDGVEQDYVVADLDSVDFPYSLFVVEKATRRLQSVHKLYSPSMAPLTAFSQGFFVQSA